MRRAGFIFSLDAFVAFTLSMFTIGLLIFTIGTPKSFYPSLEQAQQLAHDTLAVWAATPCPGFPEQTYLGCILADPGNRDYYYATAGGEFTENPPGQLYDRGMIPIGYGYRLENYSLSSGGGSWQTLYDSGTDTGSNRHGKEFTKLRASAGTILSLYDIVPMPGESPFCYGSCLGYYVNAEGKESYLSTCNVTPCDRPTSNFRPGLNSIRMVRLVVYT